MGYKFILNPLFTLEYILSSNNPITVSDLSKALIMAQGIKYFITKCVPKVGIS